MKKKKIKIIKIVLISFLTLSILFMASVYAMLRGKVSVVGRVNLAEQSNVVKDYEVLYTVASKWHSNGKFYSIINMTLKNNTDTVLNGWNIQITIPEGAAITSYSNTNCTVNGSTVLFENLSYNSEVQPKSDVTFQFQVSALNKYYEPQNILINGNVVSPPQNPGQGGGQEEIKQAQVQFIKESSWSSGQYYYFQYTGIVKNTGNTEIYGWEFRLSEKDIIIDQIWNAKLNNNGKISNTDYNGIIPVNGQISFGFIFRKLNQDINLQADNIALK